MSEVTRDDLTAMIDALDETLGTISNTVDQITAAIVEIQERGNVGDIKASDLLGLRSLFDSLDGPSEKASKTAHEAAQVARKLSEQAPTPTA